jgi:hypothetical protein
MAELANLDERLIYTHLRASSKFIERKYGYKMGISDRMLLNKFARESAQDYTSKCTVQRLVSDIVTSARYRFEREILSYRPNRI